MRHIHKEGIIACVDLLEGETIEHVSGSNDNTCCLVFTRMTDQTGTLTGTAIHHNGCRVRSTNVALAHNDQPFTMSPDGLHVATVATETTDGETISDVILDGKTRFTVPFDTIGHLAWLDRRRLACMAYNRDERCRARFFIDGVDLTGKFDFEIVWADQGRLQTLVRENGQAYIIKHDGRRVDCGPCDHAKSLHDTDFMPVDAPAETQRAEFVNENFSQRISFLGRTGPKFDAIREGLDLPIYNRDHGKVAYVGVRNFKPLEYVMRGAGRIINEYGHEKNGSLNHLLMWPVAFLCNPYFGPLHLAFETTKKHFPVNDHRPWRKSYSAVERLVYLSGDRLAAVVVKHGQLALSIEGDDGPLYDRIENLVEKPDGTLHYLASRGNNIYRVTVS